MVKITTEDIYCDKTIATSEGRFIIIFLYIILIQIIQQVGIRTTDGAESVEVKEGLGDAYNEDTDNFDIMNEEQIAFNSFYILSNLLFSNLNSQLKKKLNAPIHRKMSPLFCSHPPPATSQCPCW